MKERPIIFSGEMVKAILEGRKTQTRRLLSPQPLYEYREHGNGRKYGEFFWRDLSWIEGQERPFMPCHYGQPGDWLWVREAWSCNSLDFESKEKVEIKYKADGFLKIFCIGRQKRDNFLGKYYSQPSIHMPRWASRITLEIVNIRMEKLQEISDEDCLAEGINKKYWPTPQAEFKKIWDSIHKKENLWETNPFVWVIKFKRIAP